MTDTTTETQDTEAQDDQPHIPAQAVYLPGESEGTVPCAPDPVCPWEICVNIPQSVDPGDRQHRVDMDTYLADHGCVRTWIDRDERVLYASMRLPHHTVARLGSNWRGTETGRIEIDARRIRPGDAAGFDPANPATYSIGHLAAVRPSEREADFALIDQQTLHVRDKIARTLRCDPWAIGLVVGTRGTGEVQDVIITRAPAPAGGPEKERDQWRTIARQIVGHLGWSSRVNPGGIVELHAGPEPQWPDGAVPLPWSLIPDLPLSVVGVLGVDAYSQPVSIDMSGTPHMLCVGKTGSGKTTTAQQLAVQAVGHGWELYVAEASKHGADYEFLRQWVEAGGWGCASRGHAAAVCQTVADLGEERLRSMRQLGHSNWLDLTDAEREQLGIRPVLLLVDEGTNMMQAGKEDKNIPEDHPLRQEQRQMQLATGLLSAYVPKIARTYRAAGIYMLFATQRFGTSEIGQMAGELRQNLLIRLIQGSSDRTTIDMSMVETDTAVAAYQDTHGVSADDQDTGRASRTAKGRGIIEVEGEGVYGYQACYSSRDEMRQWLESRDLPRPGGTAPEIDEYCMWVGALSSDDPDPDVAVSGHENDDDMTAASDDGGYAPDAYREDRDKEWAGGDWSSFEALENG